jgi:SAM-dependent methyltransferase
MEEAEANKDCHLKGLGGEKGRNVDRLSQVTVPLFEMDKTGALKPNPLFHRSWDRLHSRCIEYPFAASQVGEAQRLLDVGTAKCDPAWIRWLENLPIEVHATDYDAPPKEFRNVAFHRADLRQLPIPDGTFDGILAVSVVEHIGLHDPQVTSQNLPSYSERGDVEAVRELARVLRRGGRLVMTLPFGIREGLVLGGSTRCYTAESIGRFDGVLEPTLLHYYEYQHSRYPRIYPEYARSGGSVLRRLRDFLLTRWQKPSRSHMARLPNRPGRVTWRRIPMREAKATHHSHTDGVLCGVWRKP